MSSISRTTPSRLSEAISKLVCGENSRKWAAKYSAARRNFGSFPRSRRR
jgi:hypothetical protein